MLRERLAALEVSNLDWVKAFATDAPPAKLAFYAPPAAGEPPAAVAGLRPVLSLVRIDDAGIRAVLNDWLPAQGMGDDTVPLYGRLEYLVLPVVTLSLIPMGVIGRLVRATVLDIIGQDFVGALSAKGLTRWPVIRHIAKNAAPPILALMGLQFGYLLGGSILVETVFNWPGSGNLLNLAIFRRDIPILQATILVLATFFVMLNLLVDIAQAAIDPRIRR